MRLTAPRGRVEILSSHSARGPTEGGEDPKAGVATAQAPAAAISNAAPADRTIR